MKLLFIAMLLMNFTKAEDLINSAEIMIGDFEPYYDEVNRYNTYDSELEQIKAARGSGIKTQKNEPIKITYKSNINDDAYKARKSCLMSEKTAEECDKLFPVVKKTFTTRYEFKNVEPEEKKEIEKSEKLKSLMEQLEEDHSRFNSVPIDVEA